MFDKIRRLGTDTAIYGISTILGRFLNFLLVPFYTNILAPGQYGIVTYLYSLIAFVNVLYSYGMESAYFKYSSTLEIGSAKQNFSTPFVSLAATSLLFSLLLIPLAGTLSSTMSLPAGSELIVAIVAGILALDAIAIIPFAALRMERKASTFATIKFINILVNVVANILFLVVLRWDILGIFVSGLIASSVTVVMLLPVIRRNFTGTFHAGLWKHLLKFGLPFIPAGLATMVVQVVDRPILRALTDDATVGIYQANYRLGIFMMLVVSMYDYAWRPFYFSIAKEPDAKQVFARVLTYVVLLMSGIFLVLTFFIDDIVKIHFFGRSLIHPDYWSGLSIVPIVLLGYVFMGVSTNLSAGMYIEKKTGLLPVMAFAGAAINIVANLLLIPVMGIDGAAWATFAAYFAMALILYIIVRRVYPVRYEMGRLAKIAVSAAAVYVLSVVWTPEGWEWAYKGGLLVLFCLLIYRMRFLEKSEIAGLRRLFARGRVPVPDAGEPRV
jgi:O-antigen/teichoic acid export membrane protein